MELELTKYEPVCTGFNGAYEGNITVSVNNGEREFKGLVALVDGGWHVLNDYDEPLVRVHQKLQDQLTAAAAKAVA